MRKKGYILLGFLLLVNTLRPMSETDFGEECIAQFEDAISVVVNDQAITQIIEKVAQYTGSADEKEELFLDFISILDYELADARFWKAMGATFAAGWSIVGCFVGCLILKESFKTGLSFSEWGSLGFLLGIGGLLYYMSNKQIKTLLSIRQMLEKERSKLRVSAA